MKICNVFNLFILPGMLLCGQQVWAEKPTEVKAPVVSVKVCLNSAEITHSENVKVKSGINDLFFTGLASHVYRDYVALRNIGSAELLSIELIQICDTTDIKTLPESVLTIVGKYKDSLISIENNLQKNNFEIAALELERELFNKNTSILKHGKQISMSEFKATTDFYRIRYEENALELRNKKRDYLAHKRNKIRLLNLIFNVEGTLENDFNLCLVWAKLRNNGNEYVSDLELSYVVGDSGWIPVYEVYSINQTDLKLVYRAKILNNTGIDWNNQNIVISTNDPFEYYSAPDLTPVYINRSSRYSNQSIQNTNNVINQSKEEEVLAPDKEIYFKILKKYNFKTGMTPTFVDVTEFDLKPDFIYRCAPKKEEQVYSIARIADWERLNLMDGEARIYNKGKYLGKTYIKPGEFGEYLELPIGVVESIYVHHKLLSELSSNKVLAGEIVATRNYEIKIKYIGNEKVNIEVVDQIPVSEEKSVKTDFIDVTEGYEFDALTGKVSWKIEMNANTEKTLNMKYSITYPKWASFKTGTYNRSKSRAKF